MSQVDERYSTPIGTEFDHPPIHTIAPESVTAISKAIVGSGNGTMIFSRLGQVLAPFALRHFHTFAKPDPFAIGPYRVSAAVYQVSRNQHGLSFKIVPGTYCLMTPSADGDAHFEFLKPAVLQQGFRYAVGVAYESDESYLGFADFSPFGTGIIGQVGFLITVSDIEELPAAILQNSMAMFQGAMWSAVSPSPVVSDPFSSSTGFF
jgi:hypothetical protein